MNPELITLDSLLCWHDWHYQYSDDHSVWQRGISERDKINQEQRRLLTSGLATIEEILELTHKYAPKT